MTQRELLLANEGYRSRAKEEWERVRLLAFYATAPYAKKGFTPESIWIPGDESKEIQPTDKSKRIYLGREKIREAYLKSGFEISEEKLDKIVNLKNARKR